MMHLNLRNAGAPRWRTRIFSGPEAKLPDIVLRAFDDKIIYSINTHFHCPFQVLRFETNCRLSNVLLVSRQSSLDYPEPPEFLQTALQEFFTRTSGREIKCIKNNRLFTDLIDFFLEEEAPPCFLPQRHDRFTQGIIVLLRVL